MVAVPAVAARTRARMHMPGAAPAPAVPAWALIMAGDGRPTSAAAGLRAPQCDHSGGRRHLALCVGQSAR